MTASSTISRAERRYREATPKSAAHFVKANGVIPGGIANGGFVPPYPTYILRGEGCYLYDIEGRKLVDFMNGMTALLLGNNHPGLAKAITDQVAKGTLFTQPTLLEAELATRLRERLPSMQRLKFTASGTEATMFAVRLARAYTRKPMIAKFDGAYHGLHDDLIIANGRAEDERGLIPGVRDHVLVLPFNDIEGCQRLIEKHKDKLAGVIVEPLMYTAGSIAPKQGFLASLRDITRKNGMLLIFDEMVTFGMGVSGAQGYYHVQPDITTVGKVIGGGMPVGAFGAREDIGVLVDPAGPPAVFHGGTFAGHPVSMAAGIAHLNLLTPEVYQRLHHLGQYLRDGLRKVVRELEAPIQVTGEAHLFGYHWTSKPVVDFASKQTADRVKQHRLNLSLLGQGFYVSGFGRGTVSAALTEAELDRFFQAFRTAVKEAEEG